MIEVAWEWWQLAPRGQALGRVQVVRPDFKDRGLLDTAIVTVRFGNGALATAEATFQAVYGYDVRAEVLGSAGMLTRGDARRTHLTAYGPDGPRATGQAKLTPRVRVRTRTRTPGRCVKGNSRDV
ncbi:Gfo/Idh/MocA family oxidoreductase [Streptomyces sp. NPDC057002]|uniref:Gfo/Idh/MocA family protein n=1 Tax=Streptomyces sp. NPDC057002 TaxID=3345992 RepID=UPI0036420D36